MSHGQTYIVSNIFLPRYKTDKIILTKSILNPGHRHKSNFLTNVFLVLIFNEILPGNKGCFTNSKKLSKISLNPFGNTYHKIYSILVSLKDLLLLQRWPLLLDTGIIIISIILNHYFKWYMLRYFSF